MAFVYLTEYVTVGLARSGDMPVPQEPALAEQKLVNTGGSVASAALNSRTRLVRIHADSICSVTFGTGTPTATTSNRRFAAGQTEYVSIDAAGHAAAPISCATILNT
jgi:hypothetical protein